MERDTHSLSMLDLLLIDKECVSPFRVRKVHEALRDRGNFGCLDPIDFLDNDAGLTPLKWSIPYVGPMTILDGWNDGKWPAPSG